ncbi:hypothetical protein Fot_33780 [Forsythia ovata]|uniref:Uncharacterized protein n=1 Tax=Forsythia ovata TaxID=205694 RepID=A0ABD1TBL8_9LAMI
MAPPPCLSSSPPSPPHPPASQSLPTSAAGLESNKRTQPSTQRPYSVGSPEQWGYAISVGNIPIPISVKCSSISIDSGEYRSSSHRRDHSRSKICVAGCQHRSQICTWSAVECREDLRSSRGRGWAQAQISDLCHQMICEIDDDQSRPPEMH